MAAVLRPEFADPERGVGRDDGVPFAVAGELAIGDSDVIAVTVAPDDTVLDVEDGDRVVGRRVVEEDAAITFPNWSIVELDMLKYTVEKL